MITHTAVSIRCSARTTCENNVGWLLVGTEDNAFVQAFSTIIIPSSTCTAIYALSAAEMRNIADNFFSTRLRLFAVVN